MDVNAKTSNPLTNLIFIPVPSQNIILPTSCFIRDLKGEIIGRFVDIGGFIYNNCLEAIGRLVDIGGIVDHHCLE